MLKNRRALVDSTHNNTISLRYDWRALLAVIRAFLPKSESLVGVTTQGIVHKFYGIFSDEMYAWGGGTSVYPGYSLAIPDFTWKRSDYLTVKEVSLSYNFSGAAVNRLLGVKHLAVGLVCNNLWTFSGIKDTDPQRLTTATNYYPTMRMLKLNVNLAF